MAVTRPVWNEQKKMILFLEPIMLRLPCNMKTATGALKKEGPDHAGADNNSLLDISEDVKMLCKQGRLTEALEILHLMDNRGIYADYSINGSILQECLNNKALPEGKLVQAHMIQTGVRFKDISIANKLVTMYAKFGNIVDARRVLDRMPERNVVSWNVMIAAYSRHGYNEEALSLFYQMQETGIQPNQFTFAGVLPACANLAALKQGKEIHEEIIRCGVQSNVYVGNALIDMYAKCGSIENARDIFDNMPEQDMVSWNSMVAGYAHIGYVDEALKLFEKMPKRDVVSWTVMMAAYVRHGDAEEALRWYYQMPETGIQPNQFTFATILSACSNLVALEQGKEIHEEIIRSGYESDIVVRNALIDMYAKCGSIEYARHLFDRTPDRNEISWTAMIAGYAQNGHIDEALKLFQKVPEQNVFSYTVMIAGFAQNGHADEALKLFCQMRITGIQPNQFTFASVLPACSSLSALEKGREVHEEIIRSGFQFDVTVGNALVDMYAKCGSIENACKVFDDMPERDAVSWNAMIAAYAQNGYVRQASKLFEKMSERDVVSWNSMIAGYAQNGHGDEALKLFRQMQMAGVKPNSETFAIVLPACGYLAALEQGKELHDAINRSRFQSDVTVASALVDMYAKCGSIENARKVFDAMPRRNAVSWTTMIVAYAMHGSGKEALRLFEQMQNSGTNPNHVTFLGVLSACCHAGLVDDGWQYFDSMSQYYHITPTMEHYGCMVDLLGRAGRLDEAQDFINKMPIKPGVPVWRSLLSACRLHTNIELGELAAEQLFHLDPKNAAPYVLLLNIYAAAGRWDDIEKVRKIMKDRMVKKNPGCSWIVVNKQVYIFLAGDKSLLQTHKNLSKVDRCS
eukprot:Gb_05883 [translate_table: standard]